MSLSGLKQATAPEYSPYYRYDDLLQYAHTILALPLFTLDHVSRPPLRAIVVHQWGVDRSLGGV
jgi:hypothetical protein